METQEYRIEKVDFNLYIDEWTSLFDEHWDEVAKNKQLMKISPDYERYAALGKLGKLKSLVAYRGDEVVGYSVNILDKHLHYSDLAVAYNDLLFVKKEYRNSPVGLRLIRQTEKYMAEEGAQLMFWHAKEQTSLAKILPALRYNTHEIMFSKELKRG